MTALEHLASNFWELHQPPGLSAAEVEAAIADLQVEIPSWGFGDSGTRFAIFPHAGRPRNVAERLEDAACVNRITGAAGAVALHFPWDSLADPEELRELLVRFELEAGAVNPNLFQDSDYRNGSVTNASPRVRAKAIAHLLECVDIANRLGSTAQSLWLADGTNYPGQANFAFRRSLLREALEELYAALPAEQRLLLEYKPFEPAFYATDIADWGSALLLSQQLGERALVLVDLGHHLHGANVEQIVSLLASEGKLGGFHFNARKYADDDLIVGSVNPQELFLVFVELLASGKQLPRLTIDQAHNVEPKIEAMIQSIVNLQQAYAKALLVDCDALRVAQSEGDVLAGHRVLTRAYETDVRPLCAKVREEKGAAADPVDHFRASNYLKTKIEERV